MVIARGGRFFAGEAVWAAPTPVITIPWVAINDKGEIR